MVVLDSSILMSLFPSSLNIEDFIPEIGDVQLAVPHSVVRELEKMTKKGGMKGKKAEFAMKFLRHADVQVLHTAEDADISLLNLSDKEGVIIATADKALLKAIRKKGKPVITLRDNRLHLLR